MRTSPRPPALPPAVGIILVLVLLFGGASSSSVAAALVSGAGPVGWVRRGAAATGNVVAPLRLRIEPCALVRERGGGGGGVGSRPPPLAPLPPEAMRRPGPRIRLPLRGGTSTSLPSSSGGADASSSPPPPRRIPYNLVIDTRVSVAPMPMPMPSDGDTNANPSTIVPPRRVVDVDGLQLSELLMEVFGAEVVTTVEGDGDGDGRGDDVFDEPDVDYSDSSGRDSPRVSDSDSDSAPAGGDGRLGRRRRKRKRVWDRCRVMARMPGPPPTSGSGHTDTGGPEREAKSTVRSLEEALLLDRDDVPPNSSLSYEVEPIDEAGENGVDWCLEVQRSWKPSLLADDVVAAMPFHTDEDCAAVVGDGRDYDKILLEGGSAFGTGDHPTSRMCAEFLLDACTERLRLAAADDPRRDRDGDGDVDGGDRRREDHIVLNVLDYGSGSGILALTALLASRRAGALPRGSVVRVEGVEVDPVAVEASRRNCVANGYRVGGGGIGGGARLGGGYDDDDGAAVVEFYSPMAGTPGSELWDELTGVATEATTCTDAAGVAIVDPLPPSREGCYDVLIANILAESLVGLADTLAMLVKRGTGRIALSGLMVDQIEYVAGAYRPYFDDVRVTDRSGGWALLEGRRNSGEMVPMGR